MDQNQAIQEILATVKSIDARVTRIEHKQHTIDSKINAIFNMVNELNDWTLLSERKRDFSKKEIEI